MKRSAEDVNPLDAKRKRPTVQEFQKSAILLQLQEYKRDIDRLNQDKLNLEQECKRKDSIITDSFKNWNCLLNDLSLALPAVGPLRQTPESVLVSALFSHQASGSDWENIRTGLCNLYLEYLEKSTEQLGQVSADRVDKLSSQYHDCIKQISEIKPLIVQKDEKISSLTSKLEECQFELKTAEKKLDRLTRENQNLLQDISMAEAAVLEAKSQQSEVKSTEPAAPVNPQKFDADLEIVAQSRLKEIERLSLSNTDLLKKLDTAQIQLAVFGNQDPNELSAVKLELQQLKRTHADCLSRAQTMQKNISNFENERRKFRETIVAEEKTRLKSQKDHIEEQEKDISRLRIARDKAMAEAQLAQSKLAIEFSQIKELRQLANSRKDRIAALESQVERFKIAIAEGNGIQVLLEFFGETREEGEDIDNPIVELRTNLKAAEERVLVLQKSLDAIQNDKSDKVELLESNAKLEIKVKELEQQCKGDTALLLAQEREKTTELNAKLVASKATHTHLIAEIDSMCAALSSLEEQTSHKVLSLIDAEAQISRLVIEKNKLDQKCAVLTKQMTTLSNSHVATKKLVERQLDRIRAFEESERMLNSQLTTLEKTLLVENAGLLDYKQKIDAFQRQVDELKGVIGKMTAKNTEALKICEDRTMVLASEELAKARLTEEVNVLKRRVEGLPPLEKGNDLEEQLGDLKVSKLLIIRRGS